MIRMATMEESTPLPAISVLDDSVTLCKNLRQLLVTCYREDQPKPFRSAIRLPGLEAVDLIWQPTGLTCGVALWERGEEIVGAAGLINIHAATILLTGTEDTADVDNIERLFVERDLPLNEWVWQRMDDLGLPLGTTLCYNADGAPDEAIETAAAALGVAFFGVFGINE